MSPDGTPTRLEFDQVVERVRAEQRIDPRWRSSTQPPPVRAGGVTCWTSAEVYAAYVPGPQHEVSRELWAEIGAFVRRCVSQAPCTSPATARTRMSYATSFVAWCHAQDVPLAAERVFTPERVETYAIGVLSGRADRSVGSIRGALRTIGIACTTKAAWSRPVTPLRRNAYLALPYTADETQALWEVAEAQRNARARRYFRTLLATGLGAGLASNEVAALSARDVLHHPVNPRLWVIVLPARLVPVRQDVTAVLKELCASQPEGPLLGERVSEAAAVKHRSHALRRHLDIPRGVPQLSLSRLRTTWATAVLSEGVTIAEFLQMSGTTSAKSLELYLPHIRVRTDVEWMSIASGQPPGEQNHPSARRQRVSAHAPRTS